jgi:hypothetical protein
MVFDHDDRLDYLAWDPEAFRGEAWVDHVRETLGRDPARLEIRLVQGSKKRRVVLYPGMSCDPSFPPSARYIVINALLVPAPDADDATPVDVTSRVQKYVGNTLRSPMHMFPFDDPDELQRRFRGVKMLDLAMSVVDVPFPPSTDGGEKGVSG